MTRPYHSPSSIALGLRCRHAWAKHYLDRDREAEFPWRPELERPQWDHGKGCYVLPDGTAVSAKQRGAAVGIGLHATAERYLDPARGVPDWDWFPGRVLRSGIHHLPRPELIEFASIEASIGKVPLPGPFRSEREPRTSILIAGTRWAGFRDLLALAPAEWRRLRVPARDGLAIVDYKSTSDISKHALTAEELAADPQGNIYAIDACEELGVSSIAGRWIYFESKLVRRSIAVDVVFSLERAYGTIGPLSDVARELDQLTCSADAEKNPAACSDYGPPDRINCRYHIVNGGTCNARRPLGPLLQIRTPSKEENRMALTAEQKAKFEAAKAKKKAEAEEIAEGAEPETEETETESEPIETPTETTTKPKFDKKPVAAVGAAKGSAAGLGLLVKELEQHEKAAEGVRAKIRAAVA